MTQANFGVVGMAVMLNHVDIRLPYLIVRLQKQKRL
jgi:hypothetical protein